MKNAALRIVSTLAAGSLFMAPVISKGGHVVQLSTGETVKVAFYDETAVDEATRKSAGHRTVVVFQSSTGARIGMNTTGTRSGKVETTIWSADGKNKIKFDTDLQFGREGMPVPLTVDINGRASRFLRENDPSGEKDKLMRAKLGPQVARLSPEFVGAVKELFRLGHSGYPNLGTGWTELLTLFEPTDLAPQGTKIVSQSPMSVADQKLIGDALRH